MKFIANALNGEFITNILPGKDDEVDGALASIAYGSSLSDEKNDLIGNSLTNRYRLDIWMRYDQTIPVAIPLLKRLLNHHTDNIFCNLVPDVLHSKLIWWKGYGAYVGSANLTNRAWFTNIEAGLFLTEEELQFSGMDIEFENYFEMLRSYKEIFPLDESVIKELEKIEYARRNIEDIGSDLRKIPTWGGPTYFDKKKASDRHKEGFRREWHDALVHLSKIGERLLKHRPKWINEDVPMSWQVDQFLHAYYYNHVGDSNSKPFEDYFAKNQNDPNGAISKIIDWWEKTDSPPSYEDNTLYEGAPYIRDHLSRDKLQSLTEEEFVGICRRTHATSDHAAKMELSIMGRTDITYMSHDERLPLYASWLLQQRNKKNWNVLQLVNYVLYGGRSDDLWERIYIASHDKEYRLPHYGLNSIAELVGWALPEITYPRNGRTSKALRALGLDVKVY